MTPPPTRHSHRADGPADAPAVLLCNSLGTDLQMWDPQVEVMAERFRLLRYDLRGHGRSPATAGEYSLDDLGRDAVAVLDAAEVRQAHVCGESLGGAVALWLAIHRPDRVSRIVLSNTAARVGSARKWQERIDTVRRGGMRAISTMVIERFFSEEFRVREPDVAARFRRTLERTDPEGYVGCCAALRDADLRDAASSVAAPVLVVAGAHDAATPLRDSEWLHEHLAGSRLAVLDAAHLSNVERPTEFNAAVTAFLAAR